MLVLDVRDPGSHRSWYIYTKWTGARPQATEADVDAYTTPLGLFHGRIGGEAVGRGRCPTSTRPDRVDIETAVSHVRAAWGEQERLRHKVVVATDATPRRPERTNRHPRHILRSISVYQAGLRTGSG